MYLFLSNVSIILLLIVLNHLLSCLQWCMTGLGICTLHGFDFGVCFIVVALTGVITSTCILKYHRE